MSRLKDTDPLLAIAKVLIVLVMAAFGIAAVALVIVIPVLLFQQAEFAAALASSGSDTPLALAMGAVILLVLGILAIVAALFRFMQLLKRIIDTVGAGDPFTPANARRLLQMAWISLGVQVVAVLIEIIGAWVGIMFPDGVGDDNWHFMIDGDFAFSGQGLLLAIVLFILARVFRQGAAMRDDLEGTV